ncbi:MAG: outer membrane protein [Leucothrix sp.]
MRTNLVIAFIGTFLMGGSAHAGWNADLFLGKQHAGSLGWAGADYKTDAGQSYGVGLSKQVSPRLGLGFEVGYTKNQYTNNKPNYLSGRYLMLTGEYDFVQKGRLSVYGGLGVGVIKTEYFNASTDHKHKDTITGGRLSLGARYAVTPKTKLFLEARHIDTFSNPKVAHNFGIGPLVGAEYKGNSLLLGLRYTF